MSPSPANLPRGPRMDSQPLYQPAGKEELRLALAAATWESLPAVSAGLGALFGVYTLLITFFAPDRWRLLLGIPAGGSALALLGMCAAFRRHLLREGWTRRTPTSDGLTGRTPTSDGLTGRTPTSDGLTGRTPTSDGLTGRTPTGGLTVLLAGSIGGLVLLNSLLPLYLGGQPTVSPPGWASAYTLLLALAVAGAGYFLLLRGGLAVFLAAGLTGWLLAAGTGGYSPPDHPAGLALAVSALLAIAIQRSRIHTFRQLEGLRLQNLQRKAELQRVLRATDEAQRSLATSMAVGQRIVSILDLDALLDQVTSLIQERYRCDYVGIFLVDPSDENYLQARSGAGEVGHALVEQGFRLKIGERGYSTPERGSRRVQDTRSPEGIIGWVAAHHRPACVADTLQDKRFIAHELLPETRSELALPLEMGEQLLGVLDMQSAQPGAFNEYDVPFLHLLADQAATALHNARLYAQVNRFNQDLEKLVQQRTETLERMDHAKSDFISVTSHELRTPLTLLRGYGQMLAEEAVVKQSSVLITMVNGILAGADRLHAIVDSMLDVAKIDNRVLELSHTSFSIKALLRLVCEDLKEALAERHLTVEEDLQDIPSIEADLDALRKMFTQLIGNAIKYTPDGGRITLSDRLVPRGEVLAEDSMEIVVSDTGIGIDPQLQELIFTKFYRTGPVATYTSSKTRFKGGGPGLGLSIAKGIVEAHGGIIWAESPGYDEQLCPGSKFHVILPLRHQPKDEP